MSAAPHISVLAQEVVAAIAPQDKGIYIDGTFGAGGYTQSILQAADCSVLAIDRDPDVFSFAEKMQTQYGARLHFCTACFSDMAEVAQAAGFDNVDGVMLDLGMSSMQLNDGARGFSFMREGRLDMRMGQEGLSAQELVNAADMDLLATIISVYGEERRARAIARAIVHRREQSDIVYTHELSKIICDILGQPRHHETHPATRTFQALRIYLNDEMGELLQALRNAEQILKAGGILAVVTFHSLEDRMVKQFLTARSAHAPRPSRHLPEAESPAPPFILKPRKPIAPQQAEIDSNPRARSARLRVAQRTDAPAYDDNADIMPKRAPRIQDYMGGRA